MKKLKKFASIFLLLIILIPAVASSAQCPPGTHFDFMAGLQGGCVADAPGTSTNAGTRFLATIQSLLNAVVPVLIALGIVYLVWGIVQYVIGDSEEAKTKGKERVIFGIIGLAIIISVWGLVSIVTRTFNLQGSAPTRDELQDLLPR